MFYTNWTLYRKGSIEGKIKNAKQRNEVGNINKTEWEHNVVIWGLALGLARMLALHRFQVLLV